MTLGLNRRIPVEMDGIKLVSFFTRRRESEGLENLNKGADFLVAFCSLKTEQDIKGIEEVCSPQAWG